MRALAPAGALLTLHDSKLACISAASAAPKLDSLATLDVFGLTTAYNFSERMRAEAAGLVQALELRAERQAAGLDLAAQPDTLAGNFDSLLRVRCPSWRPNSKHSSPSRAAGAAPCHHSLQNPCRLLTSSTQTSAHPLRLGHQVMDALYQVRVHKAETDLSIDALRETLRLLAAERAPGAAKLEKRLEEVCGLTLTCWVAL